MARSIKKAPRREIIIKGLKRDAKKKMVYTKAISVLRIRTEETNCLGHTTHRPLYWQRLLNKRWKGATEMKMGSNTNNVKSC